MKHTEQCSVDQPQPRANKRLPAMVSRKAALCLVVNISVGGTASLFSVIPAVDRYSRQLSQVSGVIMLATFVVIPVLLLWAHLSRRAICFFLLLSVGTVVTAWYMMVMSFIIYSGLGRVRTPHSLSVWGGLILISVLLVAVLEWKISPWAWRQCCRSGTIDLAKGMCYPDIPTFGPGVPDVPTFWLWSLPAGWAAASGALVALLVSHSATPKLEVVFTVLICVGGSFLILGGAWVHAISPVFRILRWERKHRRKMMIGSVVVSTVVPPENSVGR
ncbi:MAG: hypothetical protein WC712_14590 [Candidatus Brocadiia bacterium]